ncbi:hypothetical protein [Nitrosopumilus sp.]|uniref:hypothetical protein n=1 Tax=Nitrosopumilus sp. TaxID=2024843 RepID=UPI002637FC92|nr:hypothetical protein [Nitrosopumilus sp.]
MKFKVSKKIDKKDLILGKIFELKENDFGDMSRLQMIQTYLEEDEKIDQEDIAYLKKICKEFAQINRNNGEEDEHAVETKSTRETENKAGNLEPKKEKSFFKFFKKQEKNSNETKSGTDEKISSDTEEIEEKIEEIENKIEDYEEKENRKSDNEERKEKSNSDKKDQDISDNEFFKEFVKSTSDSERGKNYPTLERSQLYDFDRDFSKKTEDLEEFQNSQKLELEDIGSIIKDIKSKKESFRKELDRIHAFRKDVKIMLSQYEDTEIKLNSIRSNLDSIQFNVSKQLSEVLDLQKDLTYLKDELSSLTKN